MDNQEIRKAGLKVTLPRVKILELLENSDQRHVSAEDVYKMLLDKGEEIGLATVYRVLTQFEAAGLVTRHNFEAAGLVTRHNFEGGHAVFELDRGEHHDHIVCIVCGKVAECMDSTIEERQRQIAKEHGFEMADHSLIIYGHCKEHAEG